MMRQQLRLFLAAAAVPVVAEPIVFAISYSRSASRRCVTCAARREPRDVRPMGAALRRLAALGQRLEAAVDVHRLLVRVVDELYDLDLGNIAIIDADGRVILGGDDDMGAHQVPLTAYGRRVGALHCTLPTGGLRRRDRQLLDDLAGHLAGVLHAHAFTAQLQQAREQLVLAREEERRRLRRDLHDGLGPSLAGHLLRLDVVAAKVAGQPSVVADLDALRDELRAAMVDVRRVVEGLRHRLSTSSECEVRWNKRSVG